MDSIKCLSVLILVAVSTLELTEAAVAAPSASRDLRRDRQDAFQVKAAPAASTTTNMLATKAEAPTSPIQQWGLKFDIDAVYDSNGLASATTKVPTYSTNPSLTLSYDYDATSASEPTASLFDFSADIGIKGGRATSHPDDYDSNDLVADVSLELVRLGEHKMGLFGFNPTVGYSLDLGYDRKFASRQSTFHDFSIAWDRTFDLGTSDGTIEVNLSGTVRRSDPGEFNRRVVALDAAWTLPLDGSTDFVSDVTGTFLGYQTGTNHGRSDWDLEWNNAVERTLNAHWKLAFAVLWTAHRSNKADFVFDDWTVGPRLTWTPFSK